MFILRYCMEKLCRHNTPPIAAIEGHKYPCHELVPVLMQNVDSVPKQLTCCCLRLKTLRLL